MLVIGQEIGLPGELVSNSGNHVGRYIRYRVEGYDDAIREYELSNAVSIVYLDKDIVERECKTK